MSDIEYASLKGSDEFPPILWVDSIRQAEILASIDRNRERTATVVQREVYYIDDSMAATEYASAIDGKRSTAWTRHPVEARKALRQLVRNGHADAKIITRIRVCGHITPVIN